MSIKQKYQFYIIVLTIISMGLVYFLFSHLNKLTNITNTSLPEQISELNRSIYIKVLAEETLYYDEVLTQSARNYVFTSNSDWKKRYNENETALKETISRTLQRSNVVDSINFMSLSQANDSLIKLEYLAFQLKDQGKEKEALAILESSSYSLLKKEYLASIRSYIIEKDIQIKRALTSVEQLVVKHSDQERSLIINLKVGFLVYLLALSLLTLISAYFFLKYLVDRILSLKKGAELIALGNFDAKIHFQTEDEFNALANTLNQMGDRLKNLNNTIKQEVLRKELLNQRNLFSRELHDRLGILISAMKLQLEKLVPNKNEKSEKIAAYKECSFLLNETYLQIRELSNDGIPGTIAEKGLKESLTRLFSRVQMIFNKKIQFITNIEEQDFDEKEQGSIYDLIKELLNNSIKHAHCTQIIIQVIKHEDGFLVMFEDDGRGFDAKNLDSFQGKGLQNAMQRIEQMSGKFYVDSREGKGTTITLEIPF